MFYLNMVDYPVFFLFLSTLTWDTFLTLRAWVNILPKNPYLAKRGFLEKLILKKRKKEDFR